MVRKLQPGKTVFSPGVKNVKIYRKQRRSRVKRRRAARYR